MRCASAWLFQNAGSEIRASSVASSSVREARSKIAPEIVGPSDQISRAANQFVL